jgi:hypothetical protein
VLGGLLAFAQTGTRLRDTPDAGKRSRVRDGVELLGLALLPVAFLGPTGTSAFPGWWGLVPTTAAVCLIAGGSGALLNRTVLSYAPVVLLGRISYPLYLWHFPLLAFARARGHVSHLEAGALAVLAVVLAYVTYRLVELPLRGWVRRVSWRPVPVLVGLMTAVGALGLAVTAFGGAPGRVPFPVQQLTSFVYDYAPAYRESTCFLKPDQGPDAFRPSCVDAGTQPLVVLWGDSHAAHLYPGLKALRAKRPFRLAEYAASSCPPFVGYSSTDRPHCKAVNDWVLARLRTLRPTTVILGAAWDPYPDDVPPPLGATVAALRRQGVQNIVVVGPPAKWPNGLPQALSDYYQQHHTIPLYLSDGLSDAPKQLDAPMRAQAARLGIGYVDALAVMCRAGGCLVRVGDGLDKLTVWDSQHFTSGGSAYFARAARRSCFLAFQRHARRSPAARLLLPLIGGHA